VFFSAFVPGRSILDNAMVAIEVVHYMKLKTEGKQGNMALKLDISKAYNRIDWLYLKEVMLKMEFCQQWVDWIMMCIETAVLVNQESVGHVIPRPVVPVYVILCVDGLSTFIQQAEVKGEIHGAKVCRDAPIITQLFKATEEVAHKMKSILNMYEVVSG